jgi:cyclic pyranopterin phosphate synthase
MVETSLRYGLTPYVNTNGSLLAERLPDLYGVGLRILAFGYYGSGTLYDAYVGTEGAWKRFERAVACARARYGNQIDLHINYVLNSRTCEISELDRAWRFALEYNLRLHVDLTHSSLPYFTLGPNRELALQHLEPGRIRAFVRRLEELRRENPRLYREPRPSIRSIPDWISRGPEMPVPCDAYNMLWIGADGTVRVCYAAFTLGNLHRSSLEKMLFGETHRRACRDAFRLACPGCPCNRDTRIVKHFPSLFRYA